MKQRIVAFLFAATSVCFLAGADSISLDKLTNPAANQLKGEGTYKVDPANLLTA